MFYLGLYFLLSLAFLIALKADYYIIWEAEFILSISPPIALNLVF
jgi:hypothetical protein